MWLLGIFLFCSFALAGPTRFDFRDASQRDLVQFISEAPLERVVGTTAAISGWVELDPKKLKKMRGEFEVDVRLLRTGMALRDSHLRSRFLNSPLHPFARFKIAKVVKWSHKKLSSRKPVRATVEGKFSLHGVTKTIRFELGLTYFRKSKATAQRLRGNLLRIKTAFPVDLLDYKIPWTKNIKVLLSRYLKVKVHVVGSDAKKPDLSELPDGDKPEDVRRP